MRKMLQSLMVLALAGTSSSVLNADEGQFYIAPGIQWNSFDNVTGLDNDQGYFLGFGYDFTDRISAEISTFDLEPENSAGIDVDLDHWKVDLLYDLNRSIGALDTFVVTGFGNTDFAGDNDTLWNLGAGVEYHFNDNLSWRTTLRSFNYLGRDLEDNDFGIDSALVYRFGGKRKSSPAPAPVPAPAPEQPATPTAPDADRDGVPDSRDTCPDTPRNYAVDSDGCPIPVEEVARIELLVNFDFDQADVKSEYFSEIKEVTDFLEQYPDTIIELEGHTDSLGTDEYNRGLSQRRADAVRDVMISRYGIQGSRVSARGFGESQPVASNDTDSGRADNRRVITVIIKTLQNYRPR